MMNKKQLEEFRDRLENTRTDVVIQMNSLLCWERPLPFSFDRPWRRNIQTMDRAVVDYLNQGCAE